MYKIETKVTPITESERIEIKHIACIVIFGELVRYLNSKNMSKSNVA